MRSTSVDPEVIAHFALLRRCISDCGHTLESICAAMAERGLPMDKGYLWKLLNDPDKHAQWKVAHSKALPDDIELLFSQRVSEGFGAIVVTPCAGADAVRNLVSGLVGVLAPRLPAIKPRMAKAAIDEEPR